MTKLRPPRHVSQFLAKTWEMASDADHNDVIAWTPNGSSFTVLDVPKFASEVLPQFFRHNNHSTFVRQLNMYGFVKVTGGPHAAGLTYAHPLFARDDPSAMAGIRRKTAGAGGNNADSKNNRRGASTNSNASMNSSTSAASAASIARARSARSPAMREAMSPTSPARNSGHRRTGSGASICSVASEDFSEASIATVLIKGGNKKNSSNNKNNNNNNNNEGESSSFAVSPTGFIGENNSSVSSSSSSTALITAAAKATEEANGLRSALESVLLAQAQLKERLERVEKENEDLRSRLERSNPQHRIIDMSLEHLLLAQSNQQADGGQQLCFPYHPFQQHQNQQQNQQQQQQQQQLFQQQQQQFQSQRQLIHQSLQSLQSFAKDDPELSSLLENPLTPGGKSSAAATSSANAPAAKETVEEEFFQPGFGLA